MLICIEKVNYITNFFLKILLINSKLVILGNLGIPGHTHTPKMVVSLWRNLWRYHQATNQLYLSRFLEALQRYFKLVVLNMLVIPGYAHWKLCYQPVENFINYAFLEILQRYGNLFCVLWTCLQKTLMFICMLKINLIIHFFLEILHFK